MKKLILLCFAAVISLHSWAQERTITGKVTATDHTPIPGVSVLLEGTNQGTVTDADGNYSLSVSQNGHVVFTFIGYATERVEIGSQTTIDMSMTEDVQSLQEVVVVGYGTVKKTDLTGSVATIDPEQITKRGSTGTLEGIQGQAPGVDISNTTGRAGSPFKIQIRGQQSLNGGNPLYVVDGVITDNIDFLNPRILSV